MAGGFLIREADPDDRAEWLRMRSSLHEDAARDELAAEIDAYFFRSQESDSDTDAAGSLLPKIVFVCERASGLLAGYIEVSVRNYAEGCDGATPYVESWFVDDDVRGVGIGAALMTEAEDWARSRGYREIASDALLDNVSSQKAHKALGFEEVERTVHFRKNLAR
jgi:aminoglycoside 6'-N-acetyltransferase I